MLDNDKYPTSPTQPSQSWGTSNGMAFGIFLLKHDCPKGQSKAKISALGWIKGVRDFGMMRAKYSLLRCLDSLSYCFKVQMLALRRKTTCMKDFGIANHIYCVLSCQGLEVKIMSHTVNPQTPTGRQTCGRYGARGYVGGMGIFCPYSKQHVGAQ